ncbi:putative ribonuclease H-like domain-containing protein [Tanacetum coccineum]
MVPRAVLMKSGLVSINTARQNISKTLISVNTARQVNTAHSKTTVNAARPMSYLFKTLAKLLQQNGVAERRNMTLIEAARTMLADFKLPTTFWAEAINTACHSNSFAVHKASDNAGTKWVFKNKKDERGIVIRNKGRLVAQGYTQEEGIDYDEVFASVYEFYGRTYILFGITMHQKGTPMETQKPLLKDEDGEEVNVHKYRSMIGSLMYVTSLRHDIMFIVCACARYQVNPKVSHLHAMKRIFSVKNRQWLQILQQKLSMWLLQVVVDKYFRFRINYMDIEQFWSTVKSKTVNEEVQLQALVDEKKIIITESTVRRDLQLEDTEGVDCLPNSTIFEKLTLMRQMMLSIRIWITVLVRSATVHSSLEVEQDSGNIAKTQSKATPNESSSLGTTSGSGPKRQETMGILLLKLARVESSRDEESLGEDASKQRRINAIDADEDITPVNDQDDADMLKVNTLTAKVQDKGKEKMIELEKPLKKKYQINFDEQEAIRLQAEFYEEERLTREKDEANVALIEEWDDIQAMIEYSSRSIN